MGENSCDRRRIVNTCRRRLFAAFFGFIWLSQATWGSDSSPQKQVALTFFGWSDQHVQVDGNGEHLLPAIDAMNALPGRPYPEAIGGTVDKPTFVLSLGDMTEWPSRAAIDTYEQIVTKRLKFPTYDIAGNHDLGGLSPSDTVTSWLIKRHGTLRYAFDKGGVRFIGLFSEYDEKLNDPAQPITKDALWPTAGTGSSASRST